MKRTYLCAAAAALAILLTGCSGNNSSDPADSVNPVDSADSVNSAEDSGASTSQTSAADTSGTGGADTEPAVVSTVEVPSEELPSTDPYVPTAEQTAEPPVRPETTVHVDYAQGDYVNGAVDEFNVPADYTGVRVLFTADKTVTDFRILFLTCETIDDDGNLTFSVEEVYSQPELTPDRPLVAGLEFIGDMPNNGISYVDADGTSHSFAVDMSGMDGSLYLWEF